MNILMVIIIVGVILLGANFAMTLIGGPPWSRKAEFAPVRIGGKLLSVESVSLGVTMLILGTLWFIAWIYFLFHGWQSFVSQVSWLMLHVVLQLFTALGLLLSGVAILKQWRRWRGIYLSMVAALTGGIGIAMFIYGPRGHGDPALMTVFAILTLIIGGFFTIALYILNRILTEDERANDGARRHPQ